MGFPIQPALSPNLWPQPSALSGLSIPSPESKVDQLEREIDEKTKHLLESQRAEIRREIAHMRVVITQMRAEGYAENVINASIDRLTQRCYESKNRFLEGNKQFNINKANVCARNQATTNKIKQCVPDFSPIERLPVDDEDLEPSLPVDMGIKKTQFARCVQMTMDPESPLGAMPCLVHHSKGLSEAQKKELSDFESAARAGKAINDLAVGPAVISKTINKTVGTVFKGLALSAMSEACLQADPGNYDACMKEMRCAFNGEDPEFNKAMKEVTPSWMVDASGAMESLDYRLDLFDQKMQDRYRTIPGIVKDGIAGGAELTVIAATGPVIRGSAKLIGASARGFQATSRAFFNTSQSLYSDVASAILLRKENKTLSKVVMAVTDKPVVWSTLGESAMAAHQRIQKTLSLLQDYTDGGYRSPMMSFIGSLPEGNDHLLHFLKSLSKGPSSAQWRSPTTLNFLEFVPSYYAVSLHFLENRLGRSSYAVKDFMSANRPVGGLIHELQACHLLEQFRLSNLKTITPVKAGYYRLNGPNELGGLLAIRNIEGVPCMDMFSAIDSLSRPLFLEKLGFFLERLGAAVGEVGQKSSFPTLKPLKQYLTQETDGLLSLFQTAEKHLESQGVAFMIKKQHVLKISGQFTQNPGPAGIVLEANLSDFIWNPATHELVYINPCKLVHSIIDMRWPTGVPIQDYVRLNALIQHQSTKAGLNPREVSVLQSAFEKGYQSQFPDQAHTVEALRFYQLREDLYNLTKIGTNEAVQTSGIKAFLSKFLEDESGAARLPSVRIPINAAEVSEVAQRIISRTFLPTRAPDILPAFPEAVKVKFKANVQGGGVARKRWKDKNSIYEWDSRHGYVEKYNLRGKHMGKFDAHSGEQVEGPNPRKFITP